MASEVNKKPTNIAWSAKQCLKLTFQALSRLRHTGQSHLWNDLLDERGRLQIWASNIGVFADVHASLDYRLREATDVKESILSLLGSVHGRLEQLGIDGSPEVEPPQGHKTAAKASGHNFDSQLKLEDCAEAIQAIHESLDWLHRIANSIRYASIPAQNDRAVKFPLYDNNDDVADEEKLDVTPKFRDFYSFVIKREFPGLEENIRRRLAQTMVIRRKRILYRQSRQKKWTIQQEKYHSKEAPLPTSASKSETSNLWSSGTESTPNERKVSMTDKLKTPSQLTATTLNIEEFKRASKARSTVSAATTAPLGNNIEEFVPPVPSAALMKPDFVCPYCSVILQSAQYLNERKWLQHLRKDLEPYVCLFFPCSESEEAPPLFSSITEWLAHMQTEHCMTWSCLSRNHDPASFTTQDNFEHHMRSIHPEQSGPELLPYIAASSSRPKERVFEFCPFGCEVSPATSDELNNHIADHLSFLALRTLPDLGNGDKTTNDRSSSGQHNAITAFRSTLGSIETNNLPAYYGNDFQSETQPTRLAEGPFRDQADHGSHTEQFNVCEGYFIIDEDLLGRQKSWAFIDFVTSQHQTLSYAEAMEHPFLTDRLTRQLIALTSWRKIISAIMVIQRLQKEKLQWRSLISALDLTTIDIPSDHPGKREDDALYLGWLRGNDGPAVNPNNQFVSEREFHENVSSVGDKIQLGRALNKTARYFISQALSKAKLAVTLDNQGKAMAAMKEYYEFCLLLDQPIRRISDEGMKKKLEAIRATYANRIQELHKQNPELPPPPISPPDLIQDIIDVEDRPDETKRIQRLLLGDFLGGTPIESAESDEPSDVEREVKRQRPESTGKVVVPTDQGIISAAVANAAEQAHHESSLGNSEDVASVPQQDADSSPSHIGEGMFRMDLNTVIPYYTHPDSTQMPLPSDSAHSKQRDEQQSNLSETVIGRRRKQEDSDSELGSELDDEAENMQSLYDGLWYDDWEVYNQKRFDRWQTNAERAENERDEEAETALQAKKKAGKKQRRLAEAEAKLARRDRLERKRGL